MPSLHARLVAPAAALLAFSIATSASAAKVLIYQTINDDLDGGDEAGLEAEKVFVALGHQVTLVRAYTPNPMPDDLSGFDSVWIIQVPQINVAYQGRIGAFAKAGGGLYMTGERACCEALNTSIRDIVGALLRPPYPTVNATTTEGGDLFVPVSPGPFGLTSTPNVIAKWETQAAGLIAGVPATRQVFKQSTGTGIGAAVYPPEDFIKGSGCIYIAMDLTFWQSTVAPTQDLSKYVENIQGFLENCGDGDHDGLTDEAESEYGTGVSDPDSDDDGLCDGYGTVAGVCISGEHPLDNYDDTTIPPLDDDDDNDGILTKFEVGAEETAPDVDGDKISAWLDVDSDNDNRLDSDEGTGDYDGDGIPAIVDGDDYPPEGQGGASGSGGASGDGGDGGATGGANGSGGSSTGGAGGSNASGGKGGASSGGAAQAGGASGSESGDSGGCGCRVAISPDGTRSALLALCAGLVLLARRRVRRSSCCVQ
jgi:hypothetical protein